MIPDKTVEQILETARIEDVIGDFVNLKRRGVNLLGVCPFHDEKTPSFTVSPSKGIYKCFGCGKAGNVSKFVMEHESLSYYEALKFLANRYNIEVEERELTVEERQARQLSESLYIINNFAYDYFDQQLFKTDEGKSVGLGYFKERGYLEKTIKKWNLGYASGLADDFVKLARHNKFSSSVLEASGLITKSERDFFNSRVMFSIHNLSGKIIAFAGRTLSKDKKQPKYINSPETEIYEKRKNLYGIYHAKNEIRKLDECLLVEGYTDVITLSQGGVENVVASSGTALTKDQIRLISRFTDNVKVIYDGDNAGVMAALRGLDLILEQGLNVKLVLLPDGEDPDSYFKKVGVTEFREYLENEAKDFIFFKADLLLSKVGNDPIGKSKVTTDIVESISKIPNAIIRANYIKACTELLDIDEPILVKEVDKAIDKLKEFRYREYQREKSRENQERFENDTIIKSSEIPHETPIIDKKPQLVKYKNEYQERDLVRILISGGNVWYDEKKKITVAQYLLHNLNDVIQDFENPLYKKVFLVALQALQDGVEINSFLFTNHQDEQIQLIGADVLSFPYSLADWESKGVYLQTQPPPEKNFANDSLRAIMRFKLRKAQNLIDQVSEELASGQLDEEDKILHIKILQQLHKDKSQLMKALNQIIL